MLLKEKKIKDIGEFGLIKRIQRRTPKNASVRLGIGDDTAVLRGDQRNEQLFTMDFLIEGVNFLFTKGLKILSKSFGS